MSDTQNQDAASAPAASVTLTEQGIEVTSRRITITAPAVSAAAVPADADLAPAPVPPAAPTQPAPVNVTAVVVPVVTQAPIGDAHQAKIASIWHSLRAAIISADSRVAGPISADAHAMAAWLNAHGIA